MERIVLSREVMWSNLMLQELVRNLQEAASVALQAERTDLAESLAWWARQIEERMQQSTSETRSALLDCKATEVWLG